MAKQVKKEAIKIDELRKFEILPYEGEENYAPESEKINEFVQLLAQKGYSKEELTTVWDKVRAKKLEAHERGNAETFEEDVMHRPLIVNEMTLEAALCYIFRRLLVTEMKKYYCSWLEAVAKIEEVAE